MSVYKIDSARNTEVLVKISQVNDGLLTYQYPRDGLVLVGWKERGGKHMKQGRFSEEQIILDQPASKVGKIQRG